MGKGERSLLAVVWDENDNELVNQVPAILYGANVVPGNYNTPIITTIFWRRLLTRSA